ncbi:MAG: thioredoxin family protein [Melioribacteraceae bacterium]|nr:thioredoxin family protein [Melioribacteraceae bacterium]
MANTPSNMIPLGTVAPDFRLFDTVSGTEKSLSEIQAESATVIMFLCNHCPFVKHITRGLVKIVEEYASEKISFAGISSNDVVNYPEDSPEKMRTTAEKVGYSFPYLYDETQEVAKAYDAACTPDFYVFDNNLKLVYRGQMDDSRPGNGVEVTGKDLRNALDCILNGEEINPDQKPSMGCNIKWKK